jgi:hypothetical protein
MKRLISALCLGLMVSVYSLDGFDVTAQKFKIFHHLGNSNQWCALFTDGFEIDYEAAELAEEKLGGGYFDPTIQTVIPNNLEKTEREWKRVKNQLSKLIGFMSEPFVGENGNLWRNSSKTTGELIEDALLMAPGFKEDFQAIAAKAGSVANFGPGNANLVKSESSLRRKVTSDMKEMNGTETEAVSKIGDALRGTIVVEQLQEIPLVMEEIAAYARQQGGNASFKNLWLEDRDSGYVGVHTKLLLPLIRDGQVRYLLAEMQIHLDSVVDGTMMSAKEKAHVIYERNRAGENPTVEISVASKLLFLTAMQHALDKFEVSHQAG